jgi:hypothetical protein
VRESQHGTEHQTYPTRPSRSIRRLCYGRKHPSARSPGPSRAGIGLEGNFAGHPTCLPPRTHEPAGRSPPPRPKCPPCWHPFHSPRGEPRVLGVPEHHRQSRGGHESCPGIRAAGRRYDCRAAITCPRTICGGHNRDGQTRGPGSIWLPTTLRARAHACLIIGRDQAGYNHPDPQMR